MPPTAAPDEPRQEDNVQQLRGLVSDLLTPWYDTEFNILRWLQSNDFNVGKSAHLLRRHLRWRKARNLDDDFSGLQRSETTENHAPITILGQSKPNESRLVVVDRAGLIDVNGVLKSVQPTEYIHNMFRNFERIMRNMMEIESRTGQQCFTYYVFDMEGLSFDPSLVSVINGPYRVTWQLTAMHYRNFIDKFIVINTPSYINALWSAVSSFIPEEARSRFVFTEKDWQRELLQFVDKDTLPQIYGGTRSDDVLNLPTPVPKSLYWQPKPHYPHLNELHRISIPAGKSRSLIYYAKEGTNLLIYSQNDADITVTILYATTEKASEEDFETLVPPVPKCGMTAMDCFDYLCEETGYYHIRLSNDAAWLLPSTYRMLLHDGNNEEIPPINIKEKWLKLGAKAKN